MKFFLWSALLTLAVYVAGEPMHGRRKADKSRGRFAGEASSSLPYQMSSAPSSPARGGSPAGSMSPEHDIVTVPEGEIHLKPELVNEIWEAMKQPLTRRQILRKHRLRKKRLGYHRDERMSENHRFGKVPSDLSGLSPTVKHERRLMYAGVDSKGRALKKYRNVPFEVLRTAHEKRLDHPRLDKETEIRKEYAKHLIEERSIVVDPRTQTLLTLDDIPPVVGRPRLEHVAKSTLRNRRNIEKRRERERLAAAAQQEQNLLHVAGSSGQTDSSRGEEYRVPPLRWSLRSSQSKSGKGGHLSHALDQPALVWPPGTRRQRTERYPVDDDEEYEEEHEDEQQHSSPYQEDTSMNSDAEDSNDGIGSKRSMRDILAALPSYEPFHDEPLHASSSSYLSPYAFEQPHYLPPSPQRLRYDGLDIDMNIEPPIDSD